MITRQDKTIAGILIFFACVTLVLGIAQFYKVLRAPLLFTTDNKTKGTKTEAEAMSFAAVDPNKDTDGDGLPDTDELVRLGTSPYLADSDSDGKNDREEIERGENPNCPEGQDCRLVLSRPQTGEQPETVADLLHTRDTVPVPNGAELDQQGGQPLSMSDLRAELLRAGVPKEQLDQIDDATLQSFYEETIRDVERGGVSAAPQPTSSPRAALSAAEIRAFLKSQGASDDQLSAVSDAELQRLYEEVLQKRE